MRHHFYHCKWILVVMMMTGAGLTHLGGQAQAEPVLSPTQPSSSPVQASGGPFDNATFDFGDNASDATGKVSDHRSDSTRLLEAVQNASSPSVRPTERPVRVNPPMPAKPADDNNNNNKTVADPASLSSDLNDAIKDVVRPLHRELAESDVGIALRGLRAEIDPKADQIFGHSETVHGTTSATQDRSASTSWEGQNNRYGNRDPAPTPAQTERDKILASVMMDKLIDDVKPWLIGLAVAYVLGYLIKFAIAYGKYQSTRRQRRGQRHHRTENPQGND